MVVAAQDLTGADTWEWELTDFDHDFVDTCYALELTTPTGAITSLPKAPPTTADSANSANGTAPTDPKAG